MEKIFFLGIVTLLFLTISACEAENDIVENSTDEILEEIEGIEDQSTSEEEMDSEMVDMDTTEEENSDETTEEDNSEEDSNEMEEENSEMNEEEMEGIVVGNGNFESNSSYTVDGSFAILETENGFYIEVDEDFVAAGVPDLVIYFSNENGSNESASIISEEILDNGMQSFKIPENINPENYEYVLLFCKKYTARVGFGEIER